MGGSFTFMNFQSLLQKKAFDVVDDAKMVLN